LQKPQFIIYFYLCRNACEKECSPTSPCLFSNRKATFVPGHA
jgi:hypothetical protein